MRNYTISNSERIAKTQLQQPEQAAPADWTSYGLFGLAVLFLASAGFSLIAGLVAAAVAK